MSWRDELQTAKFRNVSFEVTAHDLNTGRRGPIHIYPGRDMPEAEDMGRQEREYTVEAFVIGDDWKAKRNALIKACEEPGSGKLVHPVFGSLQVVNRGCRVSESNGEGRVARFSLVFIEAGENTFPTSSINEKDEVKTSAENLQATAADKFESVYSVVKMPSFVSESAIATISDMLGKISKVGLSPETIEGINIARKVLAKTARSGGSVTSTITGLISAIASEAPLSTVAGVSSFSVVTDNIPTTTATRIQQIANIESIGSFVRAAAIAEEGILLVNSDFSSYQDAIKAGASFADKVAKEILTPIVRDDNAIFNAYKDISSKVSRSLALGAKDLARLTTTVSADPQPALVSAYELYEDATRDSEIIARNDIEHPSFLPPATDLEVLSV